MRRPANNVMSAVKTRQKLARNRNVWGIHKDFELIFNEVLTSTIVMRRAF